MDFNCAAFPERLIESELFGYEPGALSGAVRLKPGLFELAAGGSLFLDEIGELLSGIQAKLLRVLDGAPYLRLGGVRRIVPDARIIAATNRVLEADAAAPSRQCHAPLVDWPEGGPGSGWERYVVWGN